MSLDPEVAKLVGKVKKTKDDALKLFNINDFQIDPNKIEEAKVEGVGTVKYKRIVIGDLFDLPDVKTRHEYTARLIYKMMSKADSEVTYEKICNLPPDVASRIFDVLAASIVFLTPLTPQNSDSGSTKA